MTDVFRQIRDNEVERAARSLYSEKLAFHNFTHVIHTLKFAGEIVRSLTTQLSSINLKTIYYALLFHDAGYIEDENSTGFAQKEYYAASLAEKHLTKRGLAPDEIVKITQAIKATHPDAECANLEEEIVRGADISGMAAPYEDFLNMSKAIKAEQEYFIGVKISWYDWVQGTDAHLSTYLNEKISCGELFADTSTPSLFARRLAANISRLKHEVAPASSIT